MRRSTNPWLLAAGVSAFGVLACLAFGQTYSSTVIYPSPSGIYRQLTSTGRTLLARDGDAVGIGTASPDPSSKLTVAGRTVLTGRTLLARDGDNVGIGLADPDAAVKLDIGGSLRIRGGAPGEGKVLTSDANGVARWSAPPAPPPADAGGGAIPAGMIAMFDAACPAGWTRFAPLDDKFARGGSSFGSSGGAETHSHYSAASESTSGGWPRVARGAQSGVVPSYGTTISDPAMNAYGTSSSGLPTSSASSLPPYLTVVWCRKG